MPQRKMKLDRAKRTSKPKTNLSAAHAKCETAKHHLDTSPNQPKPHRKKTA